MRHINWGLLSWLWLTLSIGWLLHYNFLTAFLTDLVIAHSFKVEHFTDLFDRYALLFCWLLLFSGLFFRFFCAIVIRWRCDCYFFLVLCLLLAALPKHGQNVVLVLTEFFCCRVVQHVVKSALWRSFRARLELLWCFGNDWICGIYLWISILTIFVNFFNFLLRTYESLSAFFREGASLTNCATAYCSTHWLATNFSCLLALVKELFNRRDRLFALPWRIIVFVIFSFNRGFSFKAPSNNLNDILAET